MATLILPCPPPVAGVPVAIAAGHAGGLAGIAKGRLWRRTGRWLRGARFLAVAPILLATILSASAAKAETAPARVPQWRSDKQDPAAVFTYLGHRMGETVDEVKTIHGPFPYARRIGPNAVLYADTSGFGYPLVTEFYLVNDRLGAMKATFDNGMTPPAEVETILVESYGPAENTEIVDWVDKFGNHIRSQRLTWHTPAGVMQFDDRFGRFDAGAVQINPDLIDGLTNKDGL